jgi:hypothetical protein
LNVVALNAIRLSIARQNKGQFTIKKNSKIIFNIRLDNTTPVKHEIEEKYLPCIMCRDDSMINEK